MHHFIHILMHYLSAGLKVRMGKWTGSFQKLLYMIPPAIPVRTAAYVSTIYSHSTNTATVTCITTRV